MEPIRFEHETVLLLLFGLPALAACFWWAFRRRRRLLERFAGAAVVDRLIDSVSRRKQIAKAVGLVAAVGLIVTALARPQWGSHRLPIRRKGVDVIVAVDTSRSMLARDVAPSRLDRAKFLLRSLVKRLRGDRVGVIAFAGAATVECPLTLDYDLALSVLDVIDADTIPVQGTAIGDTIRAAVKAFERTGRAERVLVLLTDGEDQGTDPVGAAEEAAKAGVTIYAIGIGSRQGNPILIDGKVKKDAQGDPVRTRLDAETLQRVALKTGGKYIEAQPGGDVELQEVYASINQLQKTVQESKLSTIYEERFVWFLLAAALILAWEMLQNDRVRALNRTRIPTRARARSHVDEETS